MKKRNIPRGIRNCNPLNIERGPIIWQGMRARQTDPRFLQFTDMEFGIRAGFRILHTYWHKHKLRTLRQIITRWCPPTEKGNLTDQYVNFVALKEDILPDAQLPAPDKDLTLWEGIVSKMILMECGQWVDYGTIQRGWILAFPQSAKSVFLSK